MDPIHQFEIQDVLPLIKIGERELHLTNSAIYMMVSVALIIVLMLGATSRRRLVPNRLQALAEMNYEFVANMIKNTAGEEGMKFFPLVFSLFMFILVSNLIGLIPYTFTVSSQIVVTAALALLVFFTVVIYGFYKHGLGFFRLFVPSGVPIYILPVIVVIEFLSFLTRPLSHSVRLFANMLAGHITLNVFASFVVMLSAAGFLGWIGAVLPLGLTVLLTALELLVAVLQAYVFAILTCIYLGEAIHAGH
jgi:F-type H+-transporting ATPase subunit a